MGHGDPCIESKSMNNPTAKLLALALVATLSASAADLGDFFKRKPAAGQTAGGADSLLGLSQDQMVGGLKEALGKATQQAVSNLGREDGFLKDINVRIPMPQSLQKVEKALRAVRQDKLADEFLTTMNRAAEQAVPIAASVLGDSVRQMSIADARSILTGTNNAATEYFRRTCGTNLHARFLPIVKTATENAGVTGAYKRMSEKAGAGFGGFGGGLLAREMPDLDGYITSKALDGVFLKIADQEKLIRENPLARSSDLLKKVFGAVQK